MFLAGSPDAAFAVHQHGAGAAGELPVGADGFPALAVEARQAVVGGGPDRAVLATGEAVEHAARQLAAGRVLVRALAADEARAAGAQADPEAVIGGQQRRDDAQAAAFGRLVADEAEAVEAV